MIGLKDLEAAGEVQYWQDEIMAAIFGVKLVKLRRRK